MSLGREQGQVAPGPRRDGAARRTLGASLVLGLGAILLLVPLGTGASPVAQASGPVVKIYQSAYITEQENFTVSMQVADSTGITFAYFTFCQLSSPVCYSPVVMSPQGDNWYSGTTNRMATYDGMTVGVHAGYNITIEYSNGSTLTEPSLPNQFTNLTIAQEVTGEYMFEMTVSEQLYGVGGTVQDSATGAAIAGATVALTPGNATPTTTGLTGAYSFAGVPNGTYTLAITAAGYWSTNETVTVAGQDVTKNVALTNSSTPRNQTGPTGTGGSGKTSSFLSGTTPWLIVAGVVVVAAVIAFLALRRRKPSGSTGASATPASGEPSSNQQG